MRDSWLRPRATTARSHAGIPTSDGLVTLTGVSVTVDRVPVLRGVDLRVRPGEAVGLYGANGSGKSTLLHVLARLVPAAAGSGRVLGVPLGTPTHVRARSRVALVGHTAALYPQLTLRENLHFLARLIGSDAVAADEALATVGLARAADRRTDRCSHGMLRRTELARVLLVEPMLLLLDEAHAGLDAASLGLVDLVVDAVRRRGGGAVVVSHEPERLRSVVDRTLQVVDGTLRTGRIDVRDGLGVLR